MTGADKTEKTERKRFYRKRVRLFNLIGKIKLWPSRTGQLHGIRTVEILGEKARLTTHCNKEFIVSNSMNSRAARWLRNKWFVRVCPKCAVPEWKLKKYSATLFKRHQGSMLQGSALQGSALQGSALQGSALQGSMLRESMPDSGGQPGGGTAPPLP